MSTEENKQASETVNPQLQRTPERQDQWNELTDDHLKTRVDNDSVVNFIENMVQSIGSVAVEKYGGYIPQQSSRSSEPATRKYQSKVITAIMLKLNRIDKYPDLALKVLDDTIVAAWLNRQGCKQKEYFDELECAQKMTSFFAGHRNFELAIKAASKAVAITMLHRREDEETLAELNWVLAELYAATGDMDSAIVYMRNCLALMEPEACEEDSSYKELLAQLEETRERNRMLAMA